MNVTDPLINPFIFTSFYYCKRVHDNKELSRWNSKPSHESKILTHLVDHWTIFIYLSIFPANLNFDKMFQKKGTPYLGFTFAQRKFFLKTLPKYNCSDPPLFQCQRYKIDWAGHQTKNHSITISMQKSFNQYAEFIKSYT